jgi:hypothetical protein
MKRRMSFVIKPAKGLACVLMVIVESLLYIKPSMSIMLGPPGVDILLSDEQVKESEALNAFANVTISPMGSEAFATDANV